MTINQIAKKSLAHFKSRGYIFTPDEYREVFCKEAKKANVIFEDCNKVAKLIQKLDKKYQKLLNSYKINSLYELALFLINSLNRENIEKDKEFANELLLYTKRILQVIDMLPTKAKYIASKHLDFLKPFLTPDELKKLRNEWLEFMTTYDDTFLKKVKKRCAIKEVDFVEMLPQLVSCFEKDDPDFTELVDAIIFALTPSFSSFMNDEVAILNRQLRENPALLTSKGFAKELKILTKKRIKKDKEELRRKFVDIDKITEALSRKILNLLKTADISSEEIKTISKELINIDTKDSFEVVREKLITITVSLDREINKFSGEIKRENEELLNLKRRVEILETQLEEAKKEAKIDDLTKMLNKKALNEELRKQESYYKRFNRPYSIIFFDIDHFKNVNDTYGHDAGDIILKSVALILNRYSREIDVVGRFGGEEFVIIAPETSKEGAKIFAEKIRKIVEKTKFLYKNTRINIAISGGVAERIETNSMEETLKLADERLYKAKEKGRNQIDTN